MKNVLRAIGGFFVKIGRWIANTAWIQPLLIVGGIFGIIFSIPYIKQGIEGLQNSGSSISDEIQYYKDRAISLDNAEKGESEVDKLLNNLVNEKYDDVKAKYGEKFFLTFATESCSYCEDCASGFINLSKNFTTWGLEGSFKLHTIMVDTTNTDGDYLFKKVLANNGVFFENIAADFGENDDYALYTNVSSSLKSSIQSSIEGISKAVNEDGEGLETPTTFLIDLTAEGSRQEIHPYGITTIFFNYTTLLSEVGEEYKDVTGYNKGLFLKDCWKYEKLFEKDWKFNNK